MSALRSGSTALAAALLAAGVLLAPLPAGAAQLPSAKSDLYYRLGGSSPASRAPNPAATTMRLGLGGTLGANYSCGKFDFAASWEKLMDGFANLGTVVNGAVKAGIAALPLYILQRAQPGLYELFQTYAAKAEEMVNISSKSCEQMEREVLAGQNPYSGWVSIAKGEDWKREAVASNDDIARAADRVGRNDGRNGIAWIGGPAGGEAQPPINVIGDTTRAGYNATMMMPAAFNGGGYPANRLSATFPGPNQAIDFATEVLGEEYIGICTEAACPRRATGTALGLLPRFEAEIPTAEQQMASVMAVDRPPAADLAAASAPGVPVSRDLVEAIRALPPVERGMAEARIAHDVALSRTVERALMVRNLLITGKSVPEVANNGEALRRIDRALSELNRHIDDLMFEVRVRRELISQPAQALLIERAVSRAESRSTGRRGEGDADSFRDGRVP